MRATKLKRHLFDALCDHLRLEDKDRHFRVWVEATRKDLTAGDIKRKEQVIRQMNLRVVFPKAHSYDVLLGNLSLVSILRLSDEPWVECIERYGDKNGED
ncbi:MAG: hypothetical protein Q7R94_00665 [bacterium]|nr:hypothetical protein [bacterium]